MNIGFPVLNASDKELLQFDASLHSSKLFGVYDTNNDIVKFVNSDSINNNSGLGMIQFLKDENISSIISPECYSMAAKFFNDNNIGIYQAANSHVLDNIEKLLDNKLESFGAETAIKKSSCSTDCGDCSSKCNEFEQEIVSI